MSSYTSGIALDTTTQQHASPPASPSRTRRWTLAYALYTATTNVTFTQAVWMLYLAAHGYSPFAIGLFEMGFHAAKLIAEVPTGIFADLIGRRASLIVSCVLGALAQLLFLTPTAPAIAASFALHGIGFAFRGGADSALLWGMVERSGAPDTAASYSKIFSRMFLLLLLAQTLGVATGGVLGGINGLLPFICSSVALTAGVPALLLLPEQRPATHTRPHPVTHFRAGLRAAWADPLLLGLLLLSGLTAGIMTTVGYYTQLYFHTLGFSVAAIGLIIASSIVPDALFAASAPRIMRRLPRRWVLGLFVGAEALGLLALSTQVPLLALGGFLVLLHAGDSVLYPAISTYINERSPEEQRATVLSLDTGLFSLLMVVLFPLFGFGLTRIAYGSAYLWTFAALAAGCGGIGLLVWALRRGRIDQTPA